MVTSWLPILGHHRGPRYRAIADALAEDVRRGALPPGAKLPTHRDLAWQLRVTVGTVSRAYAEAERRGLITGEVGRGTFVRSAEGATPSDIRLQPRAPDFVDLGVLRPRAPSEAVRFADTLARIASAPDLDALLDYQPHAGHLADRAAGARWLARGAVAATADEIVISAGGQHAMACVFSAIARPGETIAVEALTYPGMRALANLLHLKLAPIALDDQGMVPDALDAACRAAPVRAAYVLPTLQNPTTATMPIERRRAIADIARRHDVALVEDDVYGFLLSDPVQPLTAFAPERAFYLTATSKSLVPGLRIGYVRCPPGQVERVAAAVRATMYTTPPLMARIASLWIEDGTADQLVAEKRTEAAQRQTMVREIFATQDYRSDPAAAHFWLTVPEPWQAENFAAAARRHGVGVTPAAAFAAGRTAPNAVRVAVGTPRTSGELRSGLEKLAALLATSPESYLSVI